MSVFRLAAPLVELAVEDDLYAVDLDDAIRDDREMQERLVESDVPEADWPYLRPSAWLWYCSWRQRQGGRLPVGLLQYLEGAASSEEFRFRMRLLVLRDRDLAAGTNRETGGSGAEVWLGDHVRRAAAGDPDPFELQRHLLQIANDPSITALRSLLTTDGPYAVSLGEELFRWFEAIGVEVSHLGEWVSDLRPQDGDNRR